jgi:DNA modification methylase
MSSNTLSGVNIIFGDCVEGMGLIPDGSVDLVTADSPYNIGMRYDHYDDRRPQDEFMGWTENWLRQVVRILNDTGSLYIFAPDEWVSDVDVLCRRVLGLHRRSWVVWFYTFGVANQKNFSRSHTHILYFTKSKTDFTFNDDAVRVPSARSLVYADRRQNPKGKLPDNTWALLREDLEPYMTPDKDTWLVSRVCGTYKERQKHSSNQVPLPIMERIVLASSNRGDLVLDPFVGTGTTAVACVKHGRRFTGWDISETCVREGWRRVAAAAPDDET